MGGLVMPKTSGFFTTVSLIGPHARFIRDIDLLWTYSYKVEHANSDKIFFDFKNKSLIFERYFSRLFLLGAFSSVWSC